MQRVDGVDHQLEEAVAELGARVEHGGAGSTSAGLGRLGSRRVLQREKRRPVSALVVGWVIVFFFLISMNVFFFFVLSKYFISYMCEFFPYWESFDVLHV